MARTEKKYCRESQALGCSLSKQSISPDKQADLSPQKGKLWASQSLSWRREFTVEPFPAVDLSQDPTTEREPQHNHDNPAQKVAAIRWASAREQRTHWLLAIGYWLFGASLRRVSAGAGSKMSSLRKIIFVSPERSGAESLVADPSEKAASRR
jgi:hypothetical protein